MARRQFQQRARRRVPSWQGTDIDVVNLVTATPISLTVITEAVLEEFPTPTLIRTRGRLAVHYDALTAAPAKATVTMGIMVLPTPSLAAFPTPQTDIGSDWLWWDTAPINLIGVDSGDFANNMRMTVDSKAMRKIGVNQTVIFVAELRNFEGASNTVNINGALRFLLKAP